MTESEKAKRDVRWKERMKVESEKMEMSSPRKSWRRSFKVQHDSPFNRSSHVGICENAGFSAIGISARREWVGLRNFSSSTIRRCRKGEVRFSLLSFLLRKFRESAEKDGTAPPDRRMRPIPHGSPVDFRRRMRSYEYEGRRQSAAAKMANLNAKGCRR